MRESTRHHDFNPLVGLHPLSPPEELRGKTLAAAEAAFQKQPTPDLWSRLWWSQPIRLAWATTVVLILVGHVIITPTPSPPVRSADGWVAGSISEFDVEIQEIVDLPRISEDARVGLP